MIHCVIWSNFKISSEITLVLRGMDPDSPLYSLIRDYLIKLTSLILILTWIGVLSTTAWIRFVNFYFANKQVTSKQLQVWNRVKRNVDQWYQIKISWLWIIKMQCLSSTLEYLQPSNHIQYAAFSLYNCCTYDTCNKYFCFHISQPPSFFVLSFSSIFFLSFFSSRRFSILSRRWLDSWGWLPCFSLTIRL